MDWPVRRISEEARLFHVAPVSRPHGVSADWTDERTAKLRELHAEGYSSSYIAKELGGVSRNAVIGKVHRLGLQRALSRTGKSKATLSAKQRSGRKVMRLGQDHRPAVVRLAKIEEPPKPADFLGVSLLALEYGMCKFPHGEGAGITFCGQPADDHGPYCRFHSVLCYTKPSQRSTDAAQQRAEWQQRFNEASQQVRP